MKIALTIAGYDPSSGAGVTADLMVFAAHGVFGTSCITGLTVQSTLGVEGIYPVDASIVGQTLECLDRDLRPAGIKIGMLASNSNCLETIRYIDSINPLSKEIGADFRTPIVLDPVLRSSSGVDMVDTDGLASLRDGLLTLVDWITPNLQELAFLSGKGVSTRDDIPSACRHLQQATEKKRRIGPLGILATGGHLDRPDDYLLTPDGQGAWLPGVRIETQATHGTGCALSSAFLSNLILGMAPLEAATEAKKYVTGALRNAEKIGSGRGPINHLWKIHKVAD
jgi:hydroxymethylpyrimidine/phosphomethylpyrimidine kinase